MPGAQTMQVCRNRWPCKALADDQDNKAGPPIPGQQANGSPANGDPFDRFSIIPDA